MSKNQATVECENLSLTINENTILRNISFKLERGEHCVLLGLNGSGKTSLLKILAGYGYPSHGKLKILDRYFGEMDLRYLRKKIGWVHMDLKYEIPTFMNTAEVVASGKNGSIAFYENLTQNEEDKAEYYLELMSAQHIIKRKFGSLSTGERQRVLISRALAAEPEILLLDEPCLGLDPVSREDFLSSLSEMLKKKKDLTVFYVTHYIEEIPEDFTGIMVMKKGEILIKGEKDTVLTHAILSRIYGDNFTVHRSGNRYSVEFHY
ncbi:MAG: ATP-binding cassette domain-containing protein [Spirochaetales bacterium]|nr:ATP-binding cassette domain-containing protein [Spirochaetales bacterium]